MRTTEIVAWDAPSLPVAGRLVSRAIDGDYLVGLLIVSVLPAVFWTGLVKVACLVIGVPFGIAAALATACTIGGFLAVTYALLIRRR